MKEVIMLRVPEIAKQLMIDTTHKIFYTNQALDYLQENFKNIRNRGHNIQGRASGILLCQISRETKRTHYISTQ